MNSEDREARVTLELLQTIDGQSDVTQRHLADRLGIALGLANAYLKRCIRKGLIKVKQAPANRYLYYVTPKGFSEKSRLTAVYLRDSFDFYRRASASVNRVLAECERAHFANVGLAGASDLAEITLVRAREHDVDVNAVYDPQFTGARFLGLPVLYDMNGLRHVDAVIVTTITSPEMTCRELVSALGVRRVLVPDLLGIAAGAV